MRKKEPPTPFFFLFKKLDYKLRNRFMRIFGGYRGGRKNTPNQSLVTENWMGNNCKGVVYRAELSNTELSSTEQLNK